MPWRLSGCLFNTAPPNYPDQYSMSPRSTLKMHCGLLFRAHGLNPHVVPTLTRPMPWSSLWMALTLTRSPSWAHYFWKPVRTYFCPKCPWLSSSQDFACLFVSGRSDTHLHLCPCQCYGKETDCLYLDPGFADCQLCVLDSSLHLPGDVSSSITQRWQQNSSICITVVRIQNGNICKTRRTMPGT